MLRSGRSECHLEPGLEQGPARGLAARDSGCRPAVVIRAQGLATQAVVVEAVLAHGASYSWQI